MHYKNKKTNQTNDLISMNTLFNLHNLKAKTNIIHNFIKNEYFL